MGEGLCMETSLVSPEVEFLKVTREKCLLSLVDTEIMFL